jgi:hypothetical protein
LNQIKISEQRNYKFDLIQIKPMSEYGMSEYLVAREKQECLFELYHWWYDAAFAPCHSGTVRFDSFRSIFKDEPRVLKTIRHFDSADDIKKMLYKEIRRRTTLKTVMWRRYQDNIRFNLFCISAYRKTHVDVSFARYAILEYLHGRVLKPSF